MTALVSMTVQKHASEGPHLTRTLLRRIEVVSDVRERDALLESLLTRERPTTVGFVNAHALNLVWGDREVFKAFSQLDVLLRDGLGVKVWMRALGLDPGLNLNGTDLIPQLLERVGEGGVALFGTDSPYLETAAAKLRAKGIDVVATADGFRDPEAYVEIVRRVQPRVVVLAMGMPKQEKIAYQIRQETKSPCLIVCGGAILDFMAGRFPRAPIVLRKLGLEWAFRLALEPARLSQRYLLGVPVSFYRLTVTLLSRRQRNYLSVDRK